MSQKLSIHAVNPQPRLISQAATMLREGRVIAYPTDSAYALGCSLGNKTAIDRIRKIRQLDKHHNFTLMCRDLSEIGTYAHVSNPVFRLLKTHTPGAYTFILAASGEVPRRLQHPKRKTIGLRIPDNIVCQAILEVLAEPMLSVTLILPGEEEPLSDPDVIYKRLHNQVDMVVDGGFCGSEPTTVIDFTEAFPRIVRTGKADPSPFVK